MPLFRVVPWEKQEDLVQVGRLFFKRGEVNPRQGQLHEACNTVTAWKLRGHVPLVVRATAELIGAVLLDRLAAGERDDEDDDNDIDDAATSKAPAIQHSALVGAYSNAFSRFVTAYLDAMQKGAEKRSMHELAAELSMPREFVGVRHAIVHEANGVELRELRRLTRRALFWLHDTYWSEVIEDGAAMRVDGLLAEQDEGDEVPPDTLRGRRKYSLRAV